MKLPVKFSKSFHLASLPMFESLEERLLFVAGPDLAITNLVASFALAPIVPGDKGVVVANIQNVGNQMATGSVIFEVRASNDTTFDLTDPLLGTRKISGSLAEGDDTDISIKIAIPSTILPLDYYILVKMTSTLTTPDINAGNDVGATADTGEVVWAFGNVGMRKNVKLKINDDSGPVTFSLSGPGTGEVTPSGAPDLSFEDVTLTGTTTKSSLKINTTGSNFAKINTINVLDDAGNGTGSIKSIQAKKVNLETGVTVDGLLGSLALHDISSITHYINLNNTLLDVPAAAAVKIDVNALNTCTINTHGIPINSFKAAQAVSTDIIAPWIGSLTVKSKVGGEGNFSGVLTLNGPGGNKGVSLAKLQVSGALDGTLIDANSDIKSIAAAQWLGGGLISDDLGKVTIKGDLDADIQTDEFNSATIAGDCGGSWDVLWLGNLQVSGDLEKLTLEADYVGLVTVKGWFQSSYILANNWISSVTAGGMEDSALFAGVYGTDLPTATSDFDTANLSKIGKVLVKGVKDANGVWLNSYINSNIAAWTLIDVTINDLQFTNGGTQFGITCHELNKYLLKANGQLHTNGDWVGSDNPANPTQIVHGVNDYRLRIVSGP